MSTANKHSRIKPYTVCFKGDNVVKNKWLFTYNMIYLCTWMQMCVRVLKHVGAALPITTSLIWCMQWGISMGKETLSHSELFSTFPKPHHYFYVNFSVMSMTVPRGNHLFKSPLTFGTPTKWELPTAPRADRK